TSGLTLTNPVRIAACGSEIENVEMFYEILVSRICRRGTPLELARVDIVGAKQKLDSLVGHRSNRRELPREAGAGWQRTEEKKIVHNAVVVGELGRNASIEQTDFRSHFPFTCTLVLEIRISEDCIVSEAGPSSERNLNERDVL